MRTTRVAFWHIPFWIAGIAVLHFVELFSGVYDAQIAMGFVWSDNLLHALEGVVFAIFWLSFLHMQKRRFSKTFTVISTLLFVFLVAFLWELLEYAFLVFAPAYAYSFNIFSPSITEASFDILSNLVGAAALMLWERRS